ncbi:hypothetical protein AB6A40_010622 [Gnathostoma spinigerum]|uniref:Uncharacterized protein n=1 Tax=Gnathostoma spinigerum TaxID=75299 RepID=A0ABD6EVT9_9BILA
MQLDLIAQMEAAEAQVKDRNDKGGDIEHRPDHAGTSSEDQANDDDKPRFYESHKKSRKRIREKTPDQPERPPTPTEVIHQRESEWLERQRKRQEKHKRRQNDSESDCWNNEVMAEKESFARFSSLVDQIFEKVEDLDVVGGSDDEETEVPPELLMERQQLEELRREAQKLNSWKKFNKVPPERLTKLITILEKNVRDAIAIDGSTPLVPLFNDGYEDESDEAYRELVEDRILRAADAACTTLMIMTSPKMPKQIFIEDAIDRTIQLCKQFLKHIVYPIPDGSCRSLMKFKKYDDKRKRKLPGHGRSKTVQEIYSRMTDLVGSFAELVRVQTLTDTSILELCTLGVEPFFVDNTGELQLQSIKLLSVIFSRYEDVRKNVLQDILNSLHRLPPVKNAKNSYRMSTEDWVSNLTVLVMQLVQSTIKLPRRHRVEDCHRSNSNDEPSNPDSIVRESYAEAQKTATIFLSGFLGKCSAKAEEDYRRLFDQFLHDLLAALYKPEWPAAEMMLTITGNLLVKYYRSKSVDLSLRTAW